MTIDPATNATVILDRLVEPGLEELPVTLLVAAHPDDEIIGAGALLSKLQGSTYVVHVTDGSPRSLEDARSARCETREEYAELRQNELRAALAIVGVPESHCWSLGFVDQEAALHLTEISEMLMGIISDIRPEILLTHPYEGGHPDHDATAFAAHAACALLHEPPIVAEFTSYHNSPEGLRSGHFLANESNERALWLEESGRAVKQRLYAAFPSQAKTIQYFDIGCEKFRLAPSYNFSEPPHPGTLFYEQFPWGMNGLQWRRLAKAALADLGL